MHIPPRGVGRLVCVCFLGWFACPVAADLYKCQLADGSVLYSDNVCADGSAEPLVLLENTALDSTAERENIAQYNSPEARRQREAQTPATQLLLIRDSDTVERNARITQETRKPKKKTGKKAKKKDKKQSDKKQNENKQTDNKQTDKKKKSTTKAGNPDQKTGTGKP